MEGGESFNTIFDDVFRTIAQKMPFLLIPLINEVLELPIPRIRNLNSCATSIMKIWQDRHGFDYSDRRTIVSYGMSVPKRRGYDTADGGI